MQKLTELSLSLCVISVVSMVLYSILPDENAYKQIFKTISGLLSAALILTFIISIVKSDVFKEDFLLSYSSDTTIEDYIIEKNTEAFLKDIEKQTKSIFNKYGVNCTKIAVYAENDENSLKFFVNEDLDVLDSLAKELNESTKIKSVVIVGGPDE